MGTRTGNHADSAENMNITNGFSTVDKDDKCSEMVCYDNESLMEDDDGVTSLKKFFKKRKASKCSKKLVLGTDMGHGSGFSNKSSKLCRGKKWKKVNQIHGFTCSLCDYHSVRDSGIKNRSRIILTGAEKTLEECKEVGMSFRERKTWFFRICVI